MRHVPVRTCAGCGQRSPQGDMRRIGLVAGEDRLEWRDRGGRGTYIHDDQQCVRSFVMGKVRLPGLRARVSRQARQDLVRTGSELG